MVYLYKGSLPWQNVLGTSTIEKVRKVMESKMTIPAEVICRGLPGIEGIVMYKGLIELDSFAVLLNYSRGLKYDERPDYRFLKELLRKTAGEKEIAYDDNYDWIITNKVRHYCVGY